MLNTTKIANGLNVMIYLCKLSGFIGAVELYSSIETQIFLLAAMFVYEASFFVGCDAVALMGGS